MAGCRRTTVRVGARRSTQPPAGMDQPHVAHDRCSQPLLSPESHAMHIRDAHYEVGPAETKVHPSFTSNVEQLHSDLRSLWSGSLLARCKDAIARILLMMPRTTLEAPNKLASRTGALETDKPLKVKPQKHQFVVGKFTCFPYPSINLSASNSWHWRSLVRAKPGHGPPSPKRELTNTHPQGK